MKNQNCPWCGAKHPAGSGWHDDLELVSVLAKIDDLFPGAKWSAETSGMNVLFEVRALVGLVRTQRAISRLEFEEARLRPVPWVRLAKDVLDGLRYRDRLDLDHDELRPVPACSGDPEEPEG